jgi:hypothetical protein
LRCSDATASSFVAKVRGEVFAHFHTVAVKCHSIMRNWLLGRQDEFFVNNPINTGNDEHALEFVFFCLFYRFRSRWVLTFLVRFILFPEWLSNHC